MSKRILIAPLDWGLGHATRCIPIIRYLLKKGQQPIIAASGRPLALLKNEFPDAESVEFEGYDITYPEGSGMAWKMFRSTPHILQRIRSEHEELQRLISELQLDAVISDNRFGLYSRKIPSVYMTHQVMIKAPALVEPILYRLHADYMRRFHHVWVPDHASDGLSGDLSHRFPLPRNGRFIGPLSRFSRSDAEATIDMLVIISGPEPQRTRFERQVLEQVRGMDVNMVVVLGTPDLERDEMLGNARIVSHLPAADLEQLVASAKLVVSRSGYSTIMDLEALGKQAVFVPTPGQTEQEYLARKYHREGKHMMMAQHRFDLMKAWEQRGKYHGFEPRSSQLYTTAVDELITSLYAE